MAARARRIIQDPIVKPGSASAGLGVDIFGSPVIDPTKNVLDLVKAESRYQDGMRDMNAKLRDAETRRLEDLAKAETRRVDGLDEQRVRYEARIADDLKVNVKTTSDQLAGQLIKETGALYNQITALAASLTNQVTSATNSLSTRIADLERFRWETGGKSAVSDPALSIALADMAKSITALKDLTTRSTGQEGGRQEQRGNERSNMVLLISIAVAFFALVAIAEPVIFFFVRK
jgi:hypothetical protein